MMMCVGRPTRLALGAAAILSVISCSGGGGDATGTGGGGQVVTQVVVSPSSSSVIAGQSTAFTAVAKDGSGGTVNTPITWSTSDATIATISSGSVTGVKAGDVTVTATAGAVNGTASLKVLPAVASVTVTPSPATVIINQTTQLTATLKDASGNVITDSRTVTWSSGNEALATVSSSGLVTGKALGDLVITASIEGKTGTTALTVGPVPAATITIAPISGPLTVGDTKQLSATVKDAAGNTIGRPLTWATSDQSIATVSASGLVTAKAPGTATITASADGKSGSLSITVVAPKVTSVTVVPPSAPLSAGKTLTLTATVKDATGATVTDRTVTWTSSDPSKATVTTTGLTATVTGVSAGPVTITATSEGQSGGTAVTVVDRTAPTLAGLTTNPSSVDLSSSASVVTFSANVIDVGGSGTARVDFALNAPAGTPNSPVYTCSAMTLSAGTPSNGTWSCQMNLPAGSAAGNWTISVVALDAAFNSRSLTSADLAHAGAQATLPVTDSHPDVTPPSVVGGLNGIPPQVDVTSSPATMTVSVQLTDAGAGVGRFDIGLLAPDNVTKVGCSASAPTSGTRANGTWQCTVTIPKGAQPGAWSIAIRAIDQAFNTYYSLASSTLQVVNHAPDTAPPAFTSLTVSPTTVDLSTGAQVVTATAHLTDTGANATGVAQFVFQLTAPDSTAASCVASSPAGGTPADGTWTCQVTIPPGVAAGDWRIAVQATDNALNSKTLGTTELTAAGFPTKVTVVNP